MKSVQSVLGVSFLANGLLAVLKVIVGTIGKSSALIADGAHSFSDLLTDVISFFGDLFANQPSDLKHPYGHGRIEYLTSILMGCIIIVLGGTLIYRSTTGSIVIPDVIVIVVSSITIMIKLILSQYILKKGYQSHNAILIANGKESRMDVMSSVLVLISAIIMQFASGTIFVYADRIVSILVGVLIIKVGFSIFAENISAVIGQQEMDLVYLEQLRIMILSHEGIKSIDSVALIKFGSYYKLDLEVGLEPTLTLKEAHDIVADLEKRIRMKESRILYIIIHMNPHL